MERIHRESIEAIKLIAETVTAINATLNPTKNKSHP